MASMASGIALLCQSIRSLQPAINGLTIKGSVVGGVSSSLMLSVRGYSQATQNVRKIVEGAAGPDVGSLPFSMPNQPPTAARRRVTRFFQLFLPISGVSVMAYAFLYPDEEGLVPTHMPPQLQYLAAQQHPNQETIVNWSATHSAKPQRYFTPESESEVEAFLKAAHDAKQRLRVVGSALSPNGLALSGEGMMSMALMDRIIKVDPDRRQVTVQAGCRVQQVADALRPHGLTLQNYASIREQQIGGFTQVGAHGTGATIPPCDEQVVSLRLATPAMGTVRLSASDEPELFSLAKVGLGALGVVTELTLQCVPAHKLEETTFTATTADVRKNHARWLKGNRHLRYMWIPYTDSVVVVQCNPVGSEEAKRAKQEAAPKLSATFSEQERLQPLRQLYLSKAPSGTTAADVEVLSATQLRDALLAVSPLNKDWVVKVNKAEEEFWKRSSGQRVGYSDEILGFDCGGQQWVLETAFPVADSIEQVPSSGSKDIAYMETLMSEIKKAGVAAPSPIEQRWTSGSSSAMSPVSGPSGSVHSWVGVIMYLPDEPELRAQVTSAFHKYSRLVQEKLMPKYKATWHWAKLEPGLSEPAELGKRVATRFPAKQFNLYRSLLDPHDVLGNEWLDKVLPRTL